MTIDLALEKLIPGLQEIYGDLIDSVILYGSTARGTRTADSDVDVAILLRAGATKVMRDQMLDLVVDLELECGKVLSVLCIDYDKFAEWKGVLPFYKNIRKDGVVLWQAAYLCKTPNEARCLPGTLEALRADGVQIVILDSPEIYSEYAPYTYIEDMKEFIDRPS